jgi:D-glycero-alpha-D-manno-heptose-7-phosphate kinase
VNGSSRPRVNIPVRIDFAGGWSDVHYFSSVEGGAVLNAAIAPCVEGSAHWDDAGLRVQYSMPLPPGSHLGTSASIDVAWLALTYGLMHRSVSGIELAEEAYRLEKLLGVEGGKQDQYAAALGGFLYLRFRRESEAAEVEVLDVPAETARSLAERCVLCSVGPSPIAGSIHEDVWTRYRAGDRNVASLLRSIRDTVKPSRDALLSGDLEALARQVSANREAARALHPSNVSPVMNRMFSAAEGAGAIGSKACGEGGGGFLLFLCAEDTRTAVEAALQEQGGKTMAIEFVPTLRP